MTAWSPPEHLAEAAAGASNDVLVEPVEVVLVDQKRMQTPQPVLHRVGKRRTPEEEDPGRHDTRQRQPEWRPQRAVQRKGKRAVEFAPNLGHHVIALQNLNRTFEVPTEKRGLDGEEADQHRRNRQRHQRGLHVPADVVEVRLGVVVEALLTMKRHEDHAERVERRDEHPEQYAPVGVRCSRAVRLGHSLDQCVLRIETGEERRANQR